MDQWRDKLPFVIDDEGYQQFLYQVDQLAEEELPEHVIMLLVSFGKIIFNKAHFLHPSLTTIIVLAAENQPHYPTLFH